MRISTALFPSVFKNQLQVLQEQQVRLHRQISTGRRFDRPSEAPVDFQRSQQLESHKAADKSFLRSASEARARAEYNHLAMTDLQRVIGRASEIAIRTNRAFNSAEFNAMAAEVDGLVSEVVSLSNREKDGNFLFSGTSSSQPINTTTYAYQGNSTATTAEIQKNNILTDGIIAGGTPAAGPAVDGFLYNASKGVDVLATLRQLSVDLKAGTIASVQGADTQNLDKAMEHATEYVGFTAAQFKSIDLSVAAVRQQIQSRDEEIGAITGISLSDAIADLQQTQLAYESALQSGARILNLSLLNYIR